MTKYIKFFLRKKKNYKNLTNALIIHKNYIQKIYLEKPSLEKKIIKNNIKIKIKNKKKKFKTIIKHIKYHTYKNYIQNIILNTIKNINKILINIKYINFEQSEIYKTKKYNINYIITRLNISCKKKFPNEIIIDLKTVKNCLKITDIKMPKYCKINKKLITQNPKLFNIIKTIS